MAGILGLVRRLVKGSGLTSLEGDANLDKIESAISDLQAAAASFPSADGVTLEIVGGVVRAKDAGISTIKLVDASITNPKIAADAILPTNIFSAATQVVSSGGAATIDWSLTNSFYCTLTENTTFAFSNTKDGEDISIAITQHASSAKTVTWPSIRWSGGVAPVMSVGLSKVDVYTFTKINGVFYGAVVANCS